MRWILGVTMVFTMFCANTPAADSRSRETTDDKYKWDLTDLYESDEEWKATLARLDEEKNEIASYKGKLDSSAGDLLACLEFVTGLDKELTRLYIYASMASDLDTRVSGYQAMKQQIQQVYTDFGSRAAFLEPEILKIDQSRIDEFIAAEKGLKVYSFYLHDLKRKEEHRLSEKEERILAMAGLITGAPSNIYGILSNADIPYPEVTLSDGSQVTLNSAGYARARISSNRDDRRLVFDEFFKTIKQYRSTFGATLSAQIKKDLFSSQTREYKDCLSAALDSNNIPVEVYYSLIKNVNKNLDSFHRYLNIKKRMLGLDTLEYIDLYTPTVKSVDLEYSMEEGSKIVLEALAPLGEDYTGTIREAIENRWIDVYPTSGKRSGAYSSGNAYDVHPYILLNYNETYSDVSTMAHELGHTMHSYYSNKTQPYPLADYSIFVAEVASTFNEALLIDYMLNKLDDDETRLSLLMEYLDGLKGTVFRQTQFAEFELRIHEMVEKGEALTGENLTEVYAEIVKKYYGHDKGVCLINDLYTNEWAYIPHFYYNYYVYQYSTSFCASTALAEKVLNNEPGAKDKFLKFISSGGSDYPINILNQAGVDMTTADPFNKTMEKMNRVMDEIEKILDKK
jgi:oligoendopeptidase F